MKAVVARRVSLENDERLVFFIKCNRDFFRGISRKMELGKEGIVIQLMGGGGLKIKWVDYW